MKLCRNCEYWHYTAQWMGNCRLHPFGKDQWSQDAEPNADCEKANDFTDKSLKHQRERANVRT